MSDDYEGECPECGGEGFIEDDCFEDTCCCADPHDIVPCKTCVRLIVEQES